MLTRSALFFAALCGPLTAADEQAWIRVNRIGYLPGDVKIALLSSATPLSGTFHVGDFSAAIGSDRGAWGPFAHNYRLDFSGLQAPGTYTIRFGEVVSPPFAIGPDVYADVPGKLLEFMRLQRCGDNPVTGRKCHQQDGIDTETGQRVDLTGGWHDAADRLKHMLTTSYCVASLFLAGRAAVGEARYGAELLVRIHPDPNTLYVQIGDDRDHLPPEGGWDEDQTDYGWGAGEPRAAWPATGRPQGPKYQNESNGVANLAGRSAAALALAGKVEAAESLYRLAQARPGCVMSVPVRAPYYYREGNYFDDLEWAATELFVATHKPEYRAQALEYAARAGASEWLGRADPNHPGLPARHAHYEWFPYVNLAHWRLYPHVDDAAQRKLAGYYRAALEPAARLAEQNPYRLATPLVWCSTNDVVALATQALLYERMTGDRAFRALATEARDWIFGRNPWGVSFVVGVPVEGSASRPHHLWHKLKGRLPVGGLVDGPVYKDINDGLKYTAFGDDPLARFQSAAGVYHDFFADFSTNEPTIDGTTALLLMLTLQQRDSGER